MKKAIIGISAVLISAFVVILAVNAQDKPQDGKKCSTEASASKDCAKGPHASSCCGSMKYGSTASAQEGDHKCCKSAADSTSTADKTGKDCCKSSATAQADGKKCDQGCQKKGSQN